MKMMMIIMMMMMMIYDNDDVDDDDDDNIPGQTLYNKKCSDLFLFFFPFFLAPLPVSPRVPGKKESVRAVWMLWHSSCWISAKSTEICRSPPHYVAVRRSPSQSVAVRRSPPQPGELTPARSRDWNPGPGE